VKSVDSPSFVSLAFLNKVEYRNSDFKSFICDDVATLLKNLVNFSQVTPEFKKGKMYTPGRSAVWLAASLLDLAGMSIEFSGAITTQFCFIYTLTGVTAMPSGLHAIAKFHVRTIKLSGILDF